MNKQQSTYNLIFIATFLVTIAGSMILFIALPSKEKDDQENRVLSQRPSIHIQNLDAFPPLFETYYNDQFPFRPKLIKIFNHLKINLFDESSGANVVIGNGGWFYLRSHELPAFEAKTIFTEEELETIYSQLLLRKHLVDSNGGRFYLTIPPTKYTIYPEYLKMKYQKHNEFSKREQIINMLNERGGIDFIDYTQVFLEKKSEERLFHKTDNHWNDLGAFYASQELIKLLSPDFPEIVVPSLDDFTIHRKVETGKNLVTMLGLAEAYPEEVILLERKGKSTRVDGVKRDYPVTPGFPYPWDYEMVYVNPQIKDRKLLMIRESFAGAQIPFIAEVFSESVFIFDAWKHGVNRDIIENEKADVVILEIQESFLSNLLDEKP